MEKGLGWMALLLALVAPQTAGAGQPAACRVLVLKGEVNAGQEWRAPIGQGWVFRLVPIAAGAEPYTGWDLVVDRERPVGYPDALLLATPPWNSIGEREIGTTFGLRAQDAIGWNPRSFRFLVDEAALHEGQQLFRTLAAAGAGPPSQAAARASQRVLALAAKGAAGQLRIEDARLAPGLADAAPFAAEWAIASARLAHTQEPPLTGTAAHRGALRWMRFSITLWLPPAWGAPHGSTVSTGPCGR